MPRSDLTDRIPVVYVAGPYRARTRAQVSVNIQSARAVGLLAIRNGWSAVIPHANTGDLDLHAPDITDDFWLAATLELMRRCDAVVLVPGYETSEGTQGEIAEAKRLGIPVFIGIRKLPSASEFKGAMAAVEA